jgi:aspartate carbamoyltransferase regulatory subunit
MGVQKTKDTFFFFFFFLNEKEIKKILLIPPHFKHNIILNVEIKEKEYKRMTKIK